MNYITAMKSALLVVLAFTGEICGMKKGVSEEVKPDSGMLIIDPTVRRIFSARDQKIDFEYINHDNGHAIISPVKSQDSDSKLLSKGGHLLQIVEEQLRALNLKNDDVCQISYIDTSYGRKSCIFKYTSSLNEKKLVEKGSAVFPGCKFHIEEKNKKLRLNCMKSPGNGTELLQNEPPLDGLSNFYLDVLIPCMLKGCNAFYISSNKENIFQISRCVIGHIEPKKNSEDKQNCENSLSNNPQEFGEVETNLLYDIGYDNCTLYSEDYDFFVDTSSCYYSIQDCNREELQQLCENNQPFILVVKNLSRPDENIKMLITCVYDNCSSTSYESKYELKNDINSKIDNPIASKKLHELTVTLVDQAHPKKYTIVQRIHRFFKYYSLLAGVGGVSITSFLVWLYLNKR